MNMTRRLIGVLGACGCFVLTASAQPGDITPPPHAIRIVVAHDLDCEAAILEFESALRGAKQLNATAVVVELAGNSARLDLVNRASVALRDVGVPTVAWLDGGEDLQIGPGQVALACFADRIVARDRLAVVGEARGRVEQLAEGTVAWEIIAGELRERLVSRLNDSRSLLADPLVGRSATVYIAPDGSPRLTTNESPPPKSRLLTREVDGRVSLTMSAKDIRESGLAEAVVRDWTAAARHLGLSKRVTVNTIDLSASKAAIDAGQALAAIGDTLAEATRALDLPDPQRRRVAVSKYRDAAQRARRLLDDVEKSITETESLLVRVPEVLRTPAPGQGLLEKPSGYATKWRSIIRGHRADHAKLDEKARLFSDQ